MKIDFNTAHTVEESISRLEKWVWGCFSMKNHGEMEKAALAKPTSVFGYALVTRLFFSPFSPVGGGVMSRAENVFADKEDNRCLFNVERGGHRSVTPEFGCCCGQESNDHHHHHHGKLFLAPKSFCVFLIQFFFVGRVSLINVDIRYTQVGFYQLAQMFWNKSSPQMMCRHCDAIIGLCCPNCACR